MNITVIGTGYVGLASGAGFAEMGHEVLCLDTDAANIRILQEGGCPMVEPGLPELIQRNAAAGRLRFTTDIEEAVAHGLVQVIAVGTPPRADGSVDLRQVMAAARNVGRNMGQYKIVVDKSTVPVGTAGQVRMVISEELAKRGLHLSFSVVANPEFLREGAAVEDFLRPHRVVVGVEAGDARAESLLRELYAPFLQQPEKFIQTDIRSAELTKYAANAMLATRISLMNELAHLAEKLGADIEVVRRCIASDPRIGPLFLNAGCGYGGACLPKDVRALIHGATQDWGMPLKVLRAVQEVNEAQKHLLADKIKGRFGDLTGKHFALWGLAFKPETDDMREAPSRAVLNDLFAAGATVCAHDPAAMNQSRHVFGNEPRLTYAESPMAALQDAEALIIVTEWNDFRGPDFVMMKAKLKQPVIFDGRNVWEPQAMRDLGFEYYPIGRR
ncbi:MAG: UDP-glucose 6-dehydrogenase YwqF [Betaproteobacteria bacterium ADurb.Bin341]|nr:MAG: UDP-glucose 6-dehydrogenase YwqF [Betaproteobacteria bacterium ADurb.Bin341]